MLFNIKGLSHITLVCKDLNKTSTLLTTIFQANEIYATDKNTYSIAKEKFFKIGDLWIVIMENEGEKDISKSGVDKIYNNNYNHLAFKVCSSELPLLKFELKKMGLQVLAGRGRTKEEGESLYFYDYDNHLFEFHSGDMEERIKYYKQADLL